MHNLPYIVGFTVMAAIGFIAAHDFVVMAFFAP